MIFVSLLIWLMRCNNPLRIRYKYSLDKNTWTKTKKGRVVYDRPTHYWTINDLERIGKKTGIVVYYFSGDQFDRAQTALSEIYAGVEDTDVDFGGGESGGGGASRPVPDSSKSFSNPKYANAILIMEEKE